MYEDRNGTDIYYYYDSYGTPTAIRYYEADGTSYMFYLATNQQGDIIGIYNASGNMVVKYEYDAWGNIISTTDANGGALNSLSQKWSDINPFRYRGYYYDSETGLYYLQSRYYDAEVGRFINSDVLLDNRSLSSINPFAYCENNPVNYSDPTGYCLKEVWNWVKTSFEEFFKSVSNGIGALGDLIFTEIESIGIWIEGIVQSSKAPNNIGTGAFKKSQQNQVNSIQAQKSFFKKISTIFTGVITAVEVMSGVYDNVVKGETLSKILYDIYVDVSLAGANIFIVSLVSTLSGSLLGSSAPVIGHIFGGFCGFLAGVFLYNLTDVWDFFWGKTFREKLKEGID